MCFSEPSKPHFQDLVLECSLAGKEAMAFPNTFSWTFQAKTSKGHCSDIVLVTEESLRLLYTKLLTDNFPAASGRCCFKVSEPYSIQIRGGFWRYMAVLQALRGYWDLCNYFLWRFGSQTQKGQLSRYLQGHEMVYMMEVPPN